MAVTKIKLVRDILEKDHRRLTTRQLRDNLAEAVNYAARNQGALVLTNNGIDRVAIVSIEDLRLLEILNDLDIKDALKGHFDRNAVVRVLQDKVSPENEAGNEEERSTALP